MKKIASLIIIFILCININLYAIRIKDIASLRGMRANQLIGFSIVIGLNGTGDTPASILSRKPLTNALKKLGIEITPEQINGRSIAAVMVTASLPAFAKPGQKIDAVVSAIGDAESLHGGVLVLTPLRAANREVYALSQGLVVDIPAGIERLRQGEGAGNLSAIAVTNLNQLNNNPQRNYVPTVGRVIGGTIVEKEIKIGLNTRTRLFLNLHTPDFTTAFRLAKEVNKRFGDKSAKAVDPGTVEISVPQTYLGRTVELISKVENLEVQPDNKSKVIIDERTGVVVIGANVRILPVAISHGNMNITIKNSNPITDADQQEVNQDVDFNNIVLLKGGVDLKELVDGLNKIGIGNDDLVNILKVMKESGALKADLVIK